MFNPIIIIAIIVQGLIAKASRITGAIVGYVITTGILLWGLSLYQDGYQIALFSIPVSQPIFIVSVLVWYGFDTKGLLSAKKQAARLPAPPKKVSAQDAFKAASKLEAKGRFNDALTAYQAITDSFPQTLTAKDAQISQATLRKRMQI